MGGWSGPECVESEPQEGCAEWRQLGREPPVRFRATVARSGHCGATAATTRLGPIPTCAPRQAGERFGWSADVSRRRRLARQRTSAPVTERLSVRLSPAARRRLERLCPGLPLGCVALEQDDASGARRNAFVTLRGRASLSAACVVASANGRNAWKRPCSFRRRTLMLCGDRGYATASDAAEVLHLPSNLFDFVEPNLRLYSDTPLSRVVRNLLCLGRPTGGVTAKGSFKCCMLNLPASRSELAMPPPLLRRLPPERWSFLCSWRRGSRSSPRHRRRST